MTDTAPQPTTTKSPARTLLIIVLALVVLAGGAFVAYKLTNKRDTGQPAQIVAKQVEKALLTGDTATINKLSTAQGRAQLAKIKPSDLDGFQFGGCSVVPAKVKTRLCVFNRPGGVLSMFLTVPGDKLMVNQADVGPAGLPPIAPAPQTPPTT